MPINATLGQAAAFRGTGTGAPSVLVINPKKGELRVSGTGAFSAVTVDEGWTAFIATEPSGEGSDFVGAGTRKIYVAAAGSGGSDANTGTQASPKLTVSAGRGLLRAGKPDWLLFKKGDTWTNQTFGSFPTSGVSQTEPVLISAYGSGVRPLFQTSAAQDFISISGTSRDYIAIVGLEFYSYQRDPSNGSYAGVPTANPSGINYNSAQCSFMLIEDCKISFYGFNLVIQLQSTGNILQIRRNVVVDAYNPDGVAFSSGLYIEVPDADGLLVEENYFDHNGWNGTVAGTNTNEFNHAIYAQNDSGFTGGRCTFRRNISINNSYAGLYQRPGGTCHNNLAVGNGVGINFGYEDALNVPTGTITSNVILQSRDIVGLGLGHGILTVDCDSLTLTGNIIADSNSAIGDNEFCINLQGTTNSSATGNVFFDVPGDGFRNAGANTVTPNQIDLNGDNVEFSFPDPTRSVATYAGTIGLTATLAAFQTACRAQRRDNWDARLMANPVNNYLRAGFGMAAV